MASIKTFLLGHNNQVQDILEYLKAHQEPNEQVITFMKRLNMEGLNCRFRIHKDEVIHKPGEPDYYYFNDYMIKMKIMEGLHDPFIKQKVITLFQKKTGTKLDKLFEKVIAWETAKKAAEITGAESHINGAHGGFRPQK